MYGKHFIACCEVVLEGENDTYRVPHNSCYVATLTQKKKCPEDICEKFAYSVYIRITLDSCFLR